MKISPVLPIALSSLLTASLAAPLALRYPSPAEAEKRADTFFKNRTPNLDQVIHETLDFGSGDPLLVKKDAATTSEQKRATGSLTTPGEGSSTESFNSAIHDTLDFGGTTDPLLGEAGPVLTLVKKDARDTVEKRATGSLTTGSGESSSSLSSAIHEDLDFGGPADPIFGGSTGSLTLFKKTLTDAAEKVARAFHA